MQGEGNQRDEENQEDNEEENNQVAAKDVQNAQWSLLAAQKPAPQVQPQAPMANNVDMEIDLNNEPVIDNPQEVIINPLHASEVQNGEFLEINDLMAEEEEEIIQSMAQNPGCEIDLNALPAGPIAQEVVEVPPIVLPQEPLVDEEIPLHMLIDPANPDEELTMKKNHFS